MKLYASLQQTRLALVQGLRVPGLYLLLLLSPVLWTLAYQHKAPYSIDLGGLTDDAYLFDFYAKEHNPNLTYRWTQSVSTLLLPSIGNEPVRLSLTTIGYRPSGPSPTLKLEVRGQTFALQTQGQPHTDTFTLQRGDPAATDFKLVVSSPTFSPPGDPRKLGVILDSIVVEPTDYALSSLVIPPIGTLFSFLFTSATVYLGAIVTQRRRLIALASSAAVSVLIATLIVFARPDLGLLAGSLPSLCVWGLLFAFLGRTALDTFIEAAHPYRTFLVGAGSAAFAAAFLLRFGGLTYPQFMSSDLGLHVHGIQRVLRGEWLFTTHLPDGTPQPYPPAFYLLLSPLALLLGASDQTAGLILKWSAAVLDSSVCLGLAWAGSRLWTTRAGGLAALVYAISPAPFELFSAGNYTNLFAQSVLDITLLAALVFLTHSRATQHTIRWLPLLALGFALTMLGHYGMMLAALVIIIFFGSWAAWQLVRRNKHERASLLIAACAAGLTASVALYYWHFGGEILSQLAGVLQRALGGHSSTPPTPAAGQPSSETIYARLGRKVDTLVGTLAVIIGLFGTLLIGRLSSSARALLMSWLLVSALFFLADQTLGDAIRWYYLAAAALALLAGRYFAMLVSKRRMGRLLAWLCLATMLLHFLSIWVGDLIFARYHA